MKIAEPVVSDELPDVLHWTSAALGGSGSRVMLSGTLRLMGAVPAGDVQDQYCMGAGSDGATDLDQMQIHRLVVAAGQDETGALVLLRTDRAENVGVGRALVLGRCGLCSAPRPARQGVILAKMGLACHQISKAVPGGRPTRTALTTAGRFL